MGLEKSENVSEELHDHAIIVTLSLPSAVLYIPQAHCE